MGGGGYLFSRVFIYVYIVGWDIISSGLKGGGGGGLFQKGNQLAQIPSNPVQKLSWDNHVPRVSLPPPPRRWNIMDVPYPVGNTAVVNCRLPRGI